ncbi:MAG: hypothetical protein Q9177_002240 [Variospora cf. flavescens]
MVPLFGKLASDMDYPDPDRQSLNELEEVPCSDKASINPAGPNDEERCATEGAAEQRKAAEPRGLDTSNPDSNEARRRYSLDVLLENHRDSFTTANSNTAANVALPESIASASSVHEPSNILREPRSARRRRRVYSKEIQRLRRCMPHLENVSKVPRSHHRAELSCLDFSGGQLLSNKIHRLRSKTRKSEEDFVQSLVGNIPSEVSDRFLIVDDLSDKLIYLLGTCLHITPELFEEHLLNSGWHNNSYNDRDTDLWSTRNLAKNYVSIRWFRPIEGRVCRPYLEQDSGVMLDPLATPDSWEEDCGPTYRILHSTRPLVNLLRRPWEASLASGGFSAWEERATLWKTSVGGCHIILVLLDPLPTALPADDRSSDSYEDHCLFMNSLNRLPVLSYEDLLSPERDHLFDPGMGPENSTACVLIELIQSHGTRAIDSSAEFAPLEHLLMIILQDTLTIVRSINLALADMDSSMLDDELLQSSIDSWRRVLNRFETELRHMEISLPEFARYVVGPEAAGGNGTCGELLDQCTLQIVKVQERRRITYGSLMTAMSLVESKRGIAEAESVTKLTELAFFFIPLTFAASLFSMQVKELDASTTSVGVFFGVALSITVCSYALRLVIRSSTFLRFKRLWTNDIRTSTESPPGAPIATSMVLKWTWNRFRPHMYPVYAVIPTTAVLAGLWARSLRQGIKVGVTIALAMLTFAGVLFFALRRLGKRPQLARKDGR